MPGNDIVGLTYVASVAFHNCIFSSVVICRLLVNEGNDYTMILMKIRKEKISYSGKIRRVKLALKSAFTSTPLTMFGWICLNWIKISRFITDNFCQTGKLSKFFLLFQNLHKTGRMKQNKSVEILV